jgi:type IV secretion system protein VirD4
MQTSQVVTLLAAGLTMFGVIGFLSLLAHYYTLDGIKSKIVGDGQHGTALWRQKRKYKTLIRSCAMSRENGGREKISPQHRD